MTRTGRAVHCPLVIPDARFARDPESRGCRALRDIAISDDDAPTLGVVEDRAAFEDFERTGMGIPGEEVEAWLRSLTTDNPLPRPRPRKLK